MRNRSRCAVFSCRHHAAPNAALAAVLGVVLLSAVLLWGCKTFPAPGAETAAPATAPFRLLLLHVNDTHSKLEPTQVRVNVDLGDPLDKKPVYLELGGFPQVWAAAEKIRGEGTRAENPNVLFLHAGDAFQGTLYFTRFGGKADADFLNAMGIDAMALGNHEFDKGPHVLKSFLDLVRFSVLSSNLDYSHELELAGGGIRPYVIKRFGGDRVAVIGLTTPETPYISSPGRNLLFVDQAEAAGRYVREVESEGVNKVVVLSHLGYGEDLRLASSVKGIDVIVGGHSHTLLGSFSDLGLTSSGNYPAVVRGPEGETVLVLTAWEGAKVVGELEVGFDADGRVSSWSGTPRLVAGGAWFRIYDLPGPEGKPVRVQFTNGKTGARAAGASGSTASVWKTLEYDGKEYSVVPDTEWAARYLGVLDLLIARLEADPRFLLVEPKPEGVEKLKSYGEGVEALKKQVVAQAAEELKRGNNRGPGPMIADSMTAKTGARIAVMNPGGVRTNLNQGPVTVAQVYELQPFGNTLVTLDLTGADVVKVLEDMCDFTVSRYEKNPGTAFVYVAGLRFTLIVDAQKGQRIRGVDVKGAGGTYEPLETAKVYKVAVNSFMASGGDKNDTLREALGKYDTGYIDSEATLEFINGKTLVNRSEERVRQIF